MLLTPSPVLPPLPLDQYEALRDHIARNGVEEPILVTSERIINHARGRGIGKAPRGGRLREVAPVGGVELERSGFLPGTDGGFSVDDEFQAHPMSCESLAKP